MKQLKNNHNSMKTVVETFLIEETVDLIYDDEQLDKWNQYVQELGLAGQTQIFKPKKSPIPFMHLKTSYKNICEELCPRKVKMNEYNLTPIPVEILELVALSKREEYFEEIQVWYDDKSPDPFVLGINYEYYSVDGTTWKKRHSNREEAQAEMNQNGWKGTPARPWGGEICYLIGKWADVKHSWEELKEIATKRFMMIKENEYKKQIKDAQRGLEDLQTEAFNKFN
jgi:hypothetical protein